MTKVSISSFVVVELIKSGKMYDESVDLQKVVRSAMDKAATEAGRSLRYVKAEAYTAADAMDRRGTLLEDLPGKSVKDLRDHFGTFLKLHAEYAEVESDSSSTDQVTHQDAGCMASFSPYPPHPRVVSRETQASHLRGVSRETQASVAVKDCAVHVRPAVIGTRSLSTSTSELISKADASTSHYLVEGVGLASVAVQTEETVHGCSLTTLHEVQASLAASLAATDAANARAAAAEQRAAVAEDRAALLLVTLEAEKAEVWRKLCKLDGREPEVGTSASESLPAPPAPQRDQCNMCWGTGVCDYDDSLCQTCLGSGWQPE